MKVLKEPLIIEFDVDETLILYSPRKGYKKIKLDYGGREQEFWISQRHIDFMKHQIERGYYIIIHSANGYEWASKVAQALDLMDIKKGHIQTKVKEYVDDKPVDVWKPHRIYLEEK